MKEYSKILADTAVLAGQIMLECNAESYRVEDTMNFILKSSKFKTCEAYAMATGVFVTVDDPRIDNVTVIKRVKNREINLNKIAQVNSISRNIVNEEIDIYTAYEMLKNLKSNNYHPLLKSFGLMIMCGAYSALFAGGFKEITVAFLVASIIPIANSIDKKLELGSFILNILSLIPMVIIIMIFKKYIFIDLNEGISIIGVIMPAVPGTAITNAIRDTFRGDYNSGAARILEAFVIALSVAIGVALGLVIAKGIL